MAFYPGHDHVIEQELHPRTELERAFVQARSWDPMHSWRRGTSDLRAGRISVAVGIYLALVRSQLLGGRTEESEATLDSINQYKEDLTPPDKLSAVRVLCNILNEVQEDEGLNINTQLLQLRLTQTAFSFTANLKEDRLAVTDALALIKKSSKVDVITDRKQQSQIDELRQKIEQYKSQVITETSQDLIEPKSNGTLNEICSLADQLATFKETLHCLIELGVFLLVKQKTDAARIVATAALACTEKLDKVSHSPLDIEISNLLCAFGDNLYTKNCREQAADCYAHGILAGTRAKVFSDRYIVDITAVATHALTSKNYEKFANALKNILAVMDFQNDESFNFVTLYNHIKAHQNLLSALSEAETNIDLSGITALKEIVDQSAKFSGTPYYTDILPFVAEILQKRMDKNCIPGFLELLWNDACSRPAVKTYNTNILPLAIITEQVLGSSTPKAVSFYKRIFEHIRNLDNANKILFWRILSKMREETDGRSSPSLLPLLAPLAKQYFLGKEFRNCLDVIERVNYMDMSDLSGINAGIGTIPHYVSALLTLTEIHLQLPDCEGDPFALLTIVEKILKANSQFETVDSEIRANILEFVDSISKPGTPKALLPVITKLNNALKTE